MPLTALSKGTKEKSGEKPPKASSSRYVGWGLVKNDHTQRVRQIGR